MGFTSSIAQRLKTRKFDQEKVMKRGKSSTSKYVEMDESENEYDETGSETECAMGSESEYENVSSETECAMGSESEYEKASDSTSKYVKMDEPEAECGTESETEYETASDSERESKQKNMKRRRSDEKTNHGVKNHVGKNKRKPNKKMHFALSDNEYDEDDIGICSETHRYIHSDDDLDDDEHEVEVLGDGTSTCDDWIPIAAGIEMLVQTKACGLRINSEAKSRKKEEREEYDSDGICNDSGQSDSEIELLSETNASGLRMDYKAKSRSNKDKNASGLRMDYKANSRRNIDKNASGLRMDYKPKSRSNNDESASGLRRDYKPKSRSNNDESGSGLRRDYKPKSRSNNGKRTIHHGMDDENLEGVHTLEEMDAFQGNKSAGSSSTNTNTHESNSGVYDQTCLKHIYDETNKNKEKFKKKKVEKEAMKEQFSVPKQKDFFNILFDSIMGKCEILKEQASEPEVKQPPVKTLPLKFRFEDEEPEPVEKSEYEKMVDGLFFEMHYGDMSNLEDDSKTENASNANINNLQPCCDDSKTENASNANINNLHPCCEGHHDLYINDEIGEICRNCGQIVREIKDIDPEFATIIRKETWSKRYGERKQLSAFNALDFSPENDDFGESFNATNGTVWDTIPGIRRKMYQHQQEGFEFLWKNLEGTIDLAELKNSHSSQIGGCIISHAPGTGKTLLTIVFMQTYLKLFPSSRPVIIAPASMLLTWEEEFRKWEVDFPFHNLNNLEFSGKEHKKLLDIVSTNRCPNNVIRLVKMFSWSKEKSILGISYNLFEKLAGEEYRIKKGNKKTRKEPVDEQSENLRKILLELPRLVVLDEGHTPRNHRSCIWNTLLKLQTERKIILSGTPFQNNFGELFNTLRLVRPATAQILANEKTFANMITAGRLYSKKQHKEMGIFTSSRAAAVDKDIEKLKAVIAPFVHIHKGSILQRSLPGLRDSVLLLNPPSLQKSLIKLIDQEPQSTFEYEHKLALASTHPSLLNYCCLNANERSGIEQHTLEKLRLDHEKGVKTKFIIELVRLSSGVHEKVLVFSQYIHPLKLIAEQLEAHFGWNEGRQVLQLHGKQDQKHRKNIITKFNDPRNEGVVLLASTKCCSEGINLVGASRVVLLDVVWNPSVERQAISRAYRLGQQKIVYTYHLMAAGTTEGDKYCRQSEKNRLSDLVFSSTTKENEKQKNPSSSFDDIILEKMLGDAHFKDMFEKIIYQPKEANLIESFGLHL